MKNYCVATAACLSALLEPAIVAGQCVELSCEIHQTYQGPAGSTFGWGVSQIADADGDGAMDMITGTPFDATGGSNAGMAVVYSSASAKAPLWSVFGNVNESLGFAIADGGVVGPDFIHGVIVGGQSSNGVLPGKVTVYCAATGCEVFTIIGEAVGDRFGHSVNSAGDVNFDGRDDILVGALANDHSGNNSGRAYIYSGLDGTLIRFLNAEGAGAQFGSGVAGVGDVSFDGWPDQVIAARGAVHPGGVGKSYAFSGKDGSLIWDQVSSPGASQYGQFFVGGIGDANADGAPDVYIGDWGHNSVVGRAYVYSGANGDVIHEVAGVGSEGIGPGRGAGDVNGDGYSDFIVGGYTSNEGAASAGKVYIRSGLDGSVLRTITSTIAGEQRGFDAVGIGDINNDGKIDFLISAAAASRVYIFNGDIAVPQPGDATGNGVVDVDDLLLVINSWGFCVLPPKHGCAADIHPPPHGDGMIDVDDLLMVINNWD